VLHSSTYDKYKDPELTVQEDLKEKLFGLGVSKDISTLVLFQIPLSLTITPSFTLIRLGLVDLVRSKTFRKCLLAVN